MFHFTKKHRLKPRPPFNGNVLGAMSTQSSIRNPRKTGNTSWVRGDGHCGVFGRRALLFALDKNPGLLQVGKAGSGNVSEGLDLKRGPIPR